MEQNKARTYFFYAIGEILLVVIGILIALQVNNWNIDRLEKAEERQILLNLRAEFEEAITQLNYLNGLRDNIVSSADSLVNLSNANGPFVEDTLDSLFMWQAYTPTFNDPTGSLSSLISSNKINCISCSSIFPPGTSLPQSCFFARKAPNFCITGSPMSFP